MLNEATQENRNAVLYVRASSSKQDKSCEGQREDGLEAVKRHGHSLLRSFEDDGISAFRHGREGREGFDAMLRFCRETAAMHGGTVIVWKLSRFSRQGPLGGMDDLLDLGRLGIKVIDCFGQQYGFTSVGESVLTVVQMHADQQYSLDLSAASSRGIRQRADAGYCHGVPPLGYVTERTPHGSVWRVNPDEAPLVEDIFKWAARGHSHSTIATRLNKRGIPTRTGKTWLPSTIRVILKNPAYGGKRAYKGGPLKDAKIETFISADLWERVFTGVRLRGKGRGKMRKYPLSGLVFCGKCGERAVLRMPTRQGGTLYRCRARDWQGGCDTNDTVEREALERAVLGVFRGLVREVGLEHLAREAARLEAEQAARLRAESQPIRDELARVQRDQDKLIELQLAGGDVGLVAARLRELEEQRQGLEARLSATGDILPVPLAEAEKMARARFERITDCRDLRGEVERVDIVGKDRVCLIAFGGVWEIETGGRK